MKIKSVTIPVKDQQKALEFYRDNLGFKVTTDQPDGQGGRWLELQAPRGDTHVVLYPPVNEAQKAMIGAFSNVLFSSDNVKQTYEDLSARGVKITVPLKEEPWGTFFQFADIDGNEFLISNND
jgi:uncharacterized glyoxalase superfamily protein PhnB